MASRFPRKQRRQAQESKRTVSMLARLGCSLIDVEEDFFGLGVIEKGLRSALLGAFGEIVTSIAGARPSGRNVDFFEPPSLSLISLANAADPARRRRLFILGIR